MSEPEPPVIGPETDPPGGDKKEFGKAAVFTVPYTDFTVTMRFLLASLAGLIIILTVAIIPPVVMAKNSKSRQTGTCNGHAEYCSRSYSNVTQIGAHDSPFDGPLLTDDQNIDVTAQLNMGIRFLQGQTHEFLGTLTLCHTSCFLRDAGSVQDYLSTVKTWLDANPNEVLTILLTNGDNKDVSEFRDAYAGAGLDALSYVPPKNPMAIGDWPTLQELIDSGKRVVNFLGTLSPNSPFYWRRGHSKTDGFFWYVYRHGREPGYCTLHPG
jgi:hypothetical protein